MFLIKYVALSTIGTIMVQSNHISKGADRMNYSLEKNSENNSFLNFIHAKYNHNEKPNSSNSKIYRRNQKETMKPAVLKKSSKIGKNAKKNKRNRTKFKNRTSEVSNRNEIVPQSTEVVTKTTAVSVTEAEQTMTKHYYILNKDEAHGDLSIEDNGKKLMVHGRTNKTGSSVHASVIAGLNFSNDTVLSDFDYVIYDRNRNNYYDIYQEELGPQRRADNGEAVTSHPIIIQVLKTDEISKTIKQLRPGASLLLGPENSENLPEVIKDGIYRINLPDVFMGKNNITPKFSNSDLFKLSTIVKSVTQEVKYQPDANLNKETTDINFNNIGYPNLNKETTHMYFNNIASPNKLHNTYQPSQYPPYYTPSSDFANYVQQQESGYHTETIFTDPTFAPNTKYNLARNPQHFMKEQLELAKKNFQKEFMMFNSSLTTEPINFLPLKVTMSTPNISPEVLLPTEANTQQFEAISAINEVTNTYSTETTTPIASMETFSAPILQTYPRGPGPPNSWTGQPNYGTTRGVICRGCSPYVKELMKMMRELKMGYFSVALIALFRSLSLKSEHDAGVLMRGYQGEVDSMLNIDHRFYLGRPLIDGLQKLAQYLLRVPSDVLQSQTKSLYNAMINRRDRFPQDINSVIDNIDKIFIDDEGIKLFTVIDKINNFPKGEPTVRQLHRALTDATYHPLIRLKYASMRQIVLDSINNLIQNYNTGPAVGRRFLTTPYPNLIQFNPTTNSMLRRRNNLLHFAQTFEAYKRFYNDSRINIFSLYSKRFRTNPMLPIQSRRKKLTTNKKKSETNRFMPTEPSNYSFKSKKNNTNSFTASTLESDEHNKHRKLNINKKKLKKLKKKQLKMYKRYGKRKKKHDETIQEISQKISQLKREILKLDSILQKYKDIGDKHEKQLDAQNTDSNIKSKHFTNADSDLTRSFPLFRSRQFKAKHVLTTMTSRVTQEKGSHATIQLKSDMTNVFGIRPAVNAGRLTLDKDVMPSKKIEDFKETVPEYKQGHKLLQSSSYSDDEDALKAHINDALRQENYFIDNTDLKDKINKYSSYSSEETILTSKLYKGFAFVNANNETVNDNYDSKS